MISEEAKEEYRKFIEIYLLPVLGISYETVKLVDCNTKRSQTKYIYFENGVLYFATDKEAVFCMHYKYIIPEDNLKLSEDILKSFFRISQYAMTNSSQRKRIYYWSDEHRYSNYKLAVQNGICCWIIGRQNAKIGNLFDKLEKWAVQTYEGKKVTFGFVINPNGRSSFENWHGSMNDFIDDDFSAVFTDCISSVIELDSECNFIKYLSITENDKIDGYDLTNTLPYRFAAVIQKYITNKRIGIFLLNNGDIILSKNREIRFVKRNLKWLNFSYAAFSNVLKELSEQNGISDDLIKSIFASTLDVSFSHSGGIISVVKDIHELTENNADGYPILNKCDDLSNCMTLYELEQCLGLVANNDDPRLKKRFLKRQMLDSIVGRKNFRDIDRKLRCELISLDGACILDLKGKPCAFGAIIKNDSGSSGGGRGAAAKKLSKYGMAIKISTDGYIELYINEQLVYAIK